MADENKRTQIANDMAFGMSGWENRPRSLMLEIRKFLDNVKDKGTSIDSGGGDGTGDLWVTVDGVEYFVTVKLSNKQLAKFK